MKKIYVAHPYTTHGDPIDNFNKQVVICKKLFDLGYIPVSPILTFGSVIPHDEKNYDTAMNACLWLLSSCNEVWFFGDWKKSKGCNIEYRAAIEMGKGIGYGFFCKTCGADTTYVPTASTATPQSH